MVCGLSLRAYDYKIGWKSNPRSPCKHAAALPKINAFLGPMSLKATVEDSKMESILSS